MNEKIGSKLEEAFSKILKEELNESQEWIKKRQVEIDEETKKLDVAIENIKNHLSEIKCFSEVEI